RRCAFSSSRDSSRPRITSKKIYTRSICTGLRRPSKDYRQTRLGRWPERNPNCGHDVDPPEQLFAGSCVSTRDIMRRLVQVVFTLALCLAGAGAGLAQDANKIIEQYLKAAGGNKSISRIQTFSIDGTLTSGPEAKPGTYTFRAKQPNRCYTEIQSEGKTLIESYNGKSAWHQIETGDINTLLGPQALAKRKIGAAFKGHTQVHGRDALQVELTYPTGVQWEVYFDSQSHLIVEEQATVAGIPRDILYDDYRNLNGVKLPYKLEVHRGHDSYAVNVTRAAVNETVGERVFDFPKKSQVQLPDLKKLFEEIDANQKQIDKIKENYAGTNVEEETEFDKTGKVTKTEAKEYTFFYLNGEEVSTLAKKDGKPLSDDEQKKENEKTQKRIEEIQKNEKKKEAK